MFKCPQHVPSIVPKTTLSDYFDCQIIDGRLYYRNSSADGTPTLWLIDRPKDLDGEVWDTIRNRLPPEVYFR